MTAASSNTALSTASEAALWSLDSLRGAEPVLGLAIVIIVAVVAAEALHRLIRLPRACGWMMTGALASPLALRLIDRSDLDPYKPLIDLAIGVLVFELGARVRLRWLADNPWLAVASVLEAALAGVLVAFALVSLGAPLRAACIAGAVAMATSPVITLVAVHEARPRGQVTERLMLMTALNSLLAMLAISAVQVLSIEDRDAWMTLAANSVYVVCGSFLVGVACGFALHRLGRVLLGSGTMAVLQIALITLATLLASRWRLSPLFALLVAGFVARRWLGHRLTVEPNLGSAGAALTVILFIWLGLLFTVDGLKTLWPWVLAIIGARLVGKGIAVVATARVSGLALRQAAALMLALQPMSTLAVLLAADWSVQAPGIDGPVLQALLAATTLMQLTGPLWTIVGLQHVARETEGTLPHAAV